METIKAVALDVTAELTPPLQALDWKHRWAEIETRLQEILQPQDGPIDRGSIHDARDRMIAFYVLAFHLRDYLRLYLKSVGGNPRDLESAMRNDPRLTLLEDLANLVKHAGPADKPRSGHAPKLGKDSGVTLGDDTWRVAVVIEHDGHEKDGAAIARDAVAAWRNVIMMFGLPT